MIAKVCDRESRRDTWFENRLVTKSFEPIYQSAGPILHHTALMGTLQDLGTTSNPTQSISGLQKPQFKNTLNGEVCIYMEDDDKQIHYHHHPSAAEQATTRGPNPNLRFCDGWNLGDIFSCPEFPVVRLDTMKGFSE